MSTPVTPDPEIFRELREAVMPFGRYQGRRLIELPEPYVIWLRNRGFPGGRLGELLENIYVIKANGLEYLLRPSRKGGPGGGAH
jgi:uncharacterized protein (DUF3820 family)